MPHNQVLSQLRESIKTVWVSVYVASIFKRNNYNFLISTAASVPVCARSVCVCVAYGASCLTVQWNDSWGGGVAGGGKRGKQTTWHIP